MLVLLILLVIVIVSIRSLSDSTNEAGIKDEIPFVRHLLVQRELDFGGRSKQGIGNGHGTADRSAFPLHGCCVCLAAAAAAAIFGARTEHDGTLLRLLAATRTISGGIGGR